MTLSKLKALHRARKSPDPSYDLDGDGLVGARDYFLAKRFDIDGDGKLNEREKANAINALQGEYENQFEWGVEREGAQRSLRLLQINGKIVASEDFTSLVSPVKAQAGTQDDKTRTWRELQSARKNEIMYSPAFC